MTPEICKLIHQATDAADDNDWLSAWHYWKEAASAALNAHDFNKASLYDQNAEICYAKVRSNNVFESLAVFTNGDNPVTLDRLSDGKLEVCYGAQRTTFEANEANEAVIEFANCMYHSLECAGKLDVNH